MGLERGKIYRYTDRYALPIRDSASEYYDLRGRLKFGDHVLFLEMLPVSEEGTNTWSYFVKVLVGDMVGWLWFTTKYMMEHHLVPVGEEENDRTQEG